MSGLRDICKMYGSMKVGGVTWVWDYAADEPVLETEMPHGSDRHHASERAKYLGAQSSKPSTSSIDGA